MSLKPDDPVTKRAGSSEPIGIDWTKWLTGIGASETVSASVWTVDGPDQNLTTSSPSIVTGSKKTQVVMAGGSVGATYELINTITSSSGYIDVRKLFVQIVKN